jgi:hypothetical protein
MQDEMGITRSTDGEVEKCVKILVEEREKKIPVVRTRRAWEDNIKMNKEIR